MRYSITKRCVRGTSLQHQGNYSYYIITPILCIHMVFFVDSPYASALQSFLSVTSGQLQTPEYSSNQRPEEQVYSSASPSTHE